jgi:4-hydroxy-4-methyl-2-oxoglutarate aldolase
VGELLITQAVHRRAAAVLVDAAMRDVDELASIGLPVWARWVRIRGATKTKPGGIDEPVEVGGCTIEPGDAVVLDADGVAVVPSARIDEVLAASRARADKETVKRAALEAGGLSYDLDGLRALVEP